MKRLWLGICVLALLLASGFAVTCFMERCHDPISRELAQAARAALAEDWDGALTAESAARAQWGRCRDFTAAFCDHSVLEEMDGLFAQAEVYAAGRDPLSFAATCAYLSSLADAVARSHLPNWQNLL